ncbi:LysM peptidoglycan-binding domain-containing protein [Candidatus Microgenomates bacterium]|nr:LysM peptidoglycan-binding domain-containing protein [Candidatus Microgenomates bacterium]
MNKDLQKKFKSFSNVLNDSVISMLLGALVVVLIGLVAFNFFKNKQATNPVTPTETEVTEQNFKEELTPATSTVNLPTTYTVAKGDTLWSIAEMFYTNGFDYKKIAQSNNISNVSQLEVGQKLIIPAKDTVVAAQPNRIDGTSYTVVRGDSLWDIAVRAYGDGFRWTEIARVNKLANPNIIHAGNVFVLPR